MTENSSEQSAISAKREPIAYAAPKLKVFGTVAEMTASGSNDGTENINSNVTSTAGSRKP